MGLGSIGLRHAKNALNLGHQVFGFDPDEGRQALLSSLGGTPTARERVYSCDVLIVASPTPEHFADVKESRIPTLVEKPIADRPIEFPLDYVFMVGYNLRYHSCVKQAKAWIETGYIGNPIYGSFVLAQYNAKPAYLRDGVTLNWSHEIDLALHLLGPASNLAKIDKNNTISTLFLEHDNGSASSVHLNYINKREERYFDILGDTGKIHCVLSPYRTADCYTEDGAIYSYSYNTTFDQDYVTELEAFFGNAIGPGCTAKEAVEVLNICLGLK